MLVLAGTISLLAMLPLRLVQAFAPYSTPFHPQRVVLCHQHQQSPSPLLATLDNQREDQEVQEPVLDGEVIFTKSGKTIIFDQGRFFETSRQAPPPSMVVQQQTLPQVSFQYDSSQYKPTDLIPTEILFGANIESSNLSSSSSSTNPSSSRRPLTPLEPGDWPDEQFTPADDVASSISTTTAKPTTNNNPLEQELSTATWINPIVAYCNAWNRRDLDAAAAYFDKTNGFVYHDTQYWGKITTIPELIQMWEQQAHLLPTPDTHIQIDHMAVDRIRGSVGIEWHLDDTSTGPRADTTTDDSQRQSRSKSLRGVAFYTLSADQTKIASCRLCTEMLVKPPARVADAVVASASRFLNSNSNSIDTTTTTRKTTSNAAYQSKSTLSSSVHSTILEQYFDAWNERDMEAALACFVDDCRYETEDPVFLTQLRGKVELRQHLINNARSLPSNCQIVLDDWAMDRMAVGATWHLEVGGLAVPNLQGCSMYTLDESTGLIRTGYDVTEAPVKLARQSLQSPMARWASQLLLGW